ncbi:hydrophobin family protein [Streptomyces sp. SL13]|uniref:Hydrophobin family protein n=1 Tax=Streptantibioticus silvisoli TaxID=2705255 RepID=A0AA90H683_9ACTN|nr:hydrophobin family protein [Streptantibioticus silvisoli]MDI5972666.1 hydrophobin family protein [Streptantibioticus silvisoli]
MITSSVYRRVAAAVGAGLLSTMGLAVSAAPAHATPAAARPAAAPAGQNLCCLSTESQDKLDPATAALLKVEGVSASAYPGSVGLGCRPLSLVPIAGGSSCGSQPVVCGRFDGLVALGCTPASLSPTAAESRPS